jgi:hypothetical protein
VLFGEGQGAKHQLWISKRHYLQGLTSGKDQQKALLQGLTSSKDQQKALRQGLKSGKDQQCRCIVTCDIAIPSTLPTIILYYFILLKIYISGLYSQIWLNLPRSDCQFLYIFLLTIAT